VRSRSALGLKYVEITKGSSRAGFESGATIPIARATPAPVEIDEFFAMFDEPTRAAQRTNLNEFGGALAGRGQALNEALGSFPALLRNLQPVAENLSDDRTELAGFFRGLGQAAAEAAPVAEQQASLFRNLDTTFAALADVTPEIQESISTGPEALDAAIEGFPVQRRFLANSEGFFRELRPGVRALRRAAPDLSRAFQIGRPVLTRSIQLNRRSSDLPALQAFAEDPLTSSAVNGPAQHRAHPQPDDRDLAPVQTVCNYGTTFFRNASRLLSEGDGQGTWQRFIIVAAPTGPNNEGGPANEPANGGPQSGVPTRATPRQAVPRARRRRSRRELPALQPVPEHARAAGARTSASRATSPWLRAARSSATCPGNQGTNTEETRIQRDSAGSLPSQERRRAGRPEPTLPEALMASSVVSKRKRGDDAAARPAQGPARHEPVTAAILVLAVACVACPRLHEGHPRSRRATASRRSSSRRTASARTRRCASRASTSGRSRRSAATEHPTCRRRDGDQEEGLPIHKDARLKIRSRIVLEGNFFVEMSPLSPLAP
jgi:hypothetical protein